MLCLLLIALWARSIGGLDGLSISERHVLQSSKGRLHFNSNFGIHYTIPYSEKRLTRDSHPYVFTYRDTAVDKVKYISGGHSVSHWTFIVAATGFAIIPWLPWRSSYRAFVIATRFLGVKWKPWSPGPANRTLRTLRYVLVVLSGLSIVVAGFLIAVWVSSHWRAYSLERPYGNTGAICFQSCESVLGFAISHRNPATSQGWKLFDESVEKRRTGTGGPPDPFVWMYAPGYLYVACPHWIPVMLFIVAAAAPWVRWSFSLRTLLIATTLIAILLGLTVYAKA